MPEIQIGLSENSLAVFSDASSREELPEQERQQSITLRSSVICFEFIISLIVFGSLL